MFERFTHACRGVITRANEEARQAHRLIGTEYLLLGLLEEETGLASRVLRDAGLDPQRVRAAIQQLADTPRSFLSDTDVEALRAIGIDVDAVLAKMKESFGPDALMPRPPAPRRRWPLTRRRDRAGRFSPRAKKVLELALREALHLKHNYIGTEHLLLALLREGEGRAITLITDAGIQLQELRRATLSAVGRAS